MTTYLAIPERLGSQLAAALLQSAPLESGAFCRLHAIERQGARRYVLGSVIESDEPWVDQEEDLLTPSGRRISAAASAALADRCGLAFVHTHPVDTRRSRFSRIDVDTTERLGRTFAELFDGPFASLVLSPGGWTGALAGAHAVTPIDRIATVGRTLHVGTDAVSSDDVTFDDRQIRALGDATNTTLRQLRVAVVGAGGLGSPLAETLVRMGVNEIRLIDHDALDTPSNARRIFGVGRADVETDGSVAKAKAVAAGLNRLDLDSRVVPCVGDITSAAAQRQLLDVDVIMNGTDTHSSRAALSELALRGGMPLIDVGVRVGARLNGQLDALWLERRIQLPEGPCLWCWGVLDAERVRLELLPEAQRRGLEREGYITGFAGGPAPSVAALTVTAAGVAASGLLALLGGAYGDAHLAVGVDAITLESRPFDRQEPDPTCVCSRWRLR